MALGYSLYMDVSMGTSSKKQRLPSGYLTLPWKIHPFLRSVNHLFLWATASMAMTETFGPIMYHLSSIVAPAGAKFHQLNDAWHMVSIRLISLYVYIWPNYFNSYLVSLVF